MGKGLGIGNMGNSIGNNRSKYNKEYYDKEYNKYLEELAGNKPKKWSIKKRFGLYFLLTIIFLFLFVFVI